MSLSSKLTSRLLEYDSFITETLLKSYNCDWLQFVSWYTFMIDELIHYLVRLVYYEINKSINLCESWFCQLMNHQSWITTLYTNLELLRSESACTCIIIHDKHAAMSGRNDCSTSELWLQYNLHDQTNQWLEPSTSSLLKVLYYCIWHHQPKHLTVHEYVVQPNRSGRMLGILIST